MKLLRAIFAAALLLTLAAKEASAQIYLQVANAGSTGTTVNKLAIGTGAPLTAVIAGTGTTSGVLGIVAAGAGTTGNAIIAIDGEQSCAFDGSNVANNWAVISTTVAGDCHDSGTAATSAPPAGTVGISISTNSGAGTYTIKLGGAGFPSQATSGSGTVTSVVCGTGLTGGTITTSGTCAVNGGTGVVTAIAANLSAAGGLSSTIASGTSALGTGAITSATCATVVTTTATNTATTDVIWWGFNGDPTGVVGYQAATAGMLTIIAYPTANNANFKVCNNTSSSVTPGAITLNWRVIR